MAEFNLKKLNLQIGALARAIINYDGEELKKHPDDAKILLDLQETLMSMVVTIKNPKIWGAYHGNNL